MKVDAGEEDEAVGRDVGGGLAREPCNGVSQVSYIK